MALPAWQLSALAPGLLLLCPLASGWHLAAVKSGQQPCRPVSPAPTADALTRSSRCAKRKPGPHLGQQRGLDAHKRQVLCDTGGRIWRVAVHATNGHDSRAAQPLLPPRQRLRPAWASRLRIILTHKVYRGRFTRQVQALGWQHQVASRPPSKERGFVPVAKRWVIERTFAWLKCFRRLAVDYERSPASHEAWLLVANLTMSLRRATT
jgi:transposase